MLEIYDAIINWFVRKTVMRIKVKIGVVSTSVIGFIQGAVFGVLILSIPILTIGTMFNHKTRSNLIEFLNQI